ncbi:MAG: 2-succinyl-5-enolpyruvyl-6-hydroxy-3-cyclohexene-1-carboxylic-acid synthase [Saprospiraceae bacterium]
MLSNKPHIRNLVEICALKGIEQVIISPGSRNAPLVISFGEHSKFDCISIPDERVAGFFALGIAQQTRKPVIITCTSGTASLNFAPAIAEAFYQKIPLLILTADRPVEWIHQGEGQSIAQRNVFANYVKRSYELPQEVKDKDGLWSANRIICEAIDQTTEGSGGPVHINIPFQEPLYDTKDYTHLPLPKIINTAAFEKRLLPIQLSTFVNIWQSSNKKMILGGLLPLDKRGNIALNKQLKKISQDPTVAVLPEITSNLHHKNFVADFDSVLSTVAESEISQFQPDLLVTIGGSFISKRIKLWLRKHPPKVHWHIGEIEYHLDTFQSLTTTINMKPTTFFEQLRPHISDTLEVSDMLVIKKDDVQIKVSDTLKVSDTYQATWKIQAKKVQKSKKEYLKKAEWSDLQVFKTLLPKLPKNTNLQLANSTPVRYAQLFKIRKDIIYNANRGVAGIDGSTSTATGAAYITKLPTTIITGDISFFYDSNAFWQHHLSPNLRIILINNGGGNIFRFIKGPDTTAQLADYFEAQQERSAKYLAKTYNLNYFVAENEATLKKVLIPFYKKSKNNRPAILEIKTPNVGNAEVWRGYYYFIKNQKSK